MDDNEQRARTNALDADTRSAVMPEMREVYSSAVDSIGYEQETQTLRVRWSRTGRISVYEGVPADVANQTMNAPSIGSALRDNIQGVYLHRYI